MPELPSAVTGASPLVFVDVDHTLLTISSLVDFPGYYFPRIHGEEGRRRMDQHVTGLQTLSVGGASREEINRRYYRLWAGEDAATVGMLARQWHRDRCESGELYRRAVTDRLDGLHARGAQIVLVTGSFEPCVAPIAQQVRAAAVLCSELAVVDGRFTGDMKVAMIGARKTRAVVDLVAALPEHNFAHDYAFGDHISDLPLLEMVGHPAVVPVDPELVETARLRCWPTIGG